MPPLLRAASNGDVLKLRKLLSGDQGAPSTPTFGGAAATPPAAAGANPFSNSPVFGASSTPGGGSNPLAATPKERRIAQPIVSVCGRQGVTALMYAARGGHLDCVKALLEERGGAELLNQQTTCGCTALSMAARIGDPEVLKVVTDPHYLRRAPSTNGIPVQATDQSVDLWSWDALRQAVEEGAANGKPHVVRLLVHASEWMAGQFGLQVQKVLARLDPGGLCGVRKVLMEDVHELSIAGAQFWRAIRRNFL